MVDERASQQEHQQRDVVLSDLVGRSLPLLGQLPARYLSHFTLISLIVVVALYGQSRVVDQTLEALSQGSFYGGYVAEATPTADVLVKPAAPATRFANRPKNEPIIYVARAGDTVESLAQYYDVTANTIRWANGIAVGKQVVPGQPLVILPISGVIHVVEPGDTVATLAARYHSDAQAIIDYNQITDPDSLEPNDQLVIPGGRKPEIERPQLASRAIVRPTPTPEPTSEPAPTETPAEAANAQANQPLQPSHYQVAEGDTLFAIAGKFGVSAESIIAANNIEGDGDTLQIGQQLLIPPTGSVLHTIQSGDSLEAIANRYQSQVEKIVQANGLNNPDQIQPGQVIVVPDGKIPEPTPAVVEEPSVPTITHTVQEGESVVAVADRYGVSVQTIIRANALSEPYTIHPGQQLAIPGGREQPQPAPVVVAHQVPAPPPPTPEPPPPAPPPQAEPPPPPPPPSSDGWKIVEIASKYLGYPYAWGGTTPAGFDCSGFVYYVFRQAGIYVPRDMFGQLGSGPRIAQNNLQPGDIVFFVNTYAPGLTHNGIYIGGGRFIHAANERSGVMVSSLSESYWAQRYHGASRPW